MPDYRVDILPTHHTITLKGRLDALTAPGIQELFTRVIFEGGRTLVVDLSGVHYVSSAGLRTFIATQKDLQKVGGELVLAGLSAQVHDVFQVSGFDQLFRMVPDIAAASDLCGKTVSAKGRLFQAKGISGEVLEADAPAGSLFIIGSADKLESASYTETDVVPVSPSGIRLGCGLAALGDGFDEYGALFGEALIIDSNFFYYPALRHASVDFLLAAHTNALTTYKFLHGFGIMGDYRRRLSFKYDSGGGPLQDLLDALLSISDANLLGVSLLAESRGVLGMNLKKSPLAGSPESIFSGRLFPDWFDFPVDAAHPGSVIAAAGLLARNPENLPPAIQSLFSGSAFFHLHAAILEKAPIGTAACDLEAELARVVSELRVLKVQHLLGRSRLGYGLAGLVEIGV